MKKSLFDLSWNDDSFLAKLRLFFGAHLHAAKNLQSYDLMSRAEGYSALSSTYYSICGTTKAKLGAILGIKRSVWIGVAQSFKVLAWCITWLPLGGWCYFWMLPLSNQMVALEGYEGLSPGQCDVRQSILRRRGKYVEAEMCIRSAFVKGPREAFTRGLLHVGLADVYLHQGSHQGAEMEIERALEEADAIVLEDPRQASRIYRQCASLTRSIGSGGHLSAVRLYQKAIELASSVGAKDQVLKAQS